MALDFDIYDLKIRTTESMLGTIPKNKNVFTAHVATKAADLGLLEEELLSVEDLNEKGYTGFHKDEDGYFVFDYWFHGFLKSTAQAMKTWGQLKQLRDKVVKYVFVRPRKIRLPDIEAEPLERPLRAQTPQGERVCVAKSDTIAAGAVLEMKLHVMGQSGITKNCLADLLDYGNYKGLGQWRGGGYGRFEVLSLEEE